MELRTLRYFLAVAYEGNISRAAESLYIAQPSLSRQIQSLEKELGCQLFVRKSHRVELTPEGLELRSRATEILEMVDRVESDFADKGEVSIAGDVHIAAAETAGVRMVAQVINAVHAVYPQNRVSPAIIAEWRGKPARSTSSAMPELWSQRAMQWR